MLIQGMRGLGDNIYQRAFIKQVPRDVYLDTPWPALYRDLPHVHCLRPDTHLRTQLKNVQRTKNWTPRPGNFSRSLRIAYHNGPIAGMRDCFHLAPGSFDLPDFGPSPVEGDYVVVRPVTLRSEWRADSRNPLPQYVAEAAAEMRRRGVRVVSVADLAPGQEWALDPLPDADLRFHAGEFHMEQLLALVQHAKAVIGPVGWIVPACLAAQVPAWVVLGGNGGHNAPELITPVGQSSVTFAVPDHFCRCTQASHRCNKNITNHLQKFRSWADGLFGKIDLVA